MIREQEGGFEFSSSKLAESFQAFTLDLLWLVYMKENQTKRARQTRKEVSKTLRDAFGS